MFKKILPTIVIYTNLLLITNPANAQLIRLPGVIDKPTQKTEIPEYQEKTLDVLTALGKVPELEKFADSSLVLSTLKLVEFEGNTVLKDSELQKIANPYLNNPFTKGDLAQLKYELRKAFYDAGYIFVIVTTKPQDISSGNLKFSIYEAKVNQKHFNINHKVNPKIIKAISDQIKSGDVINETKMESMISDIDDLNNLKAFLALKPGQKTATTDLIIDVSQEKEDVQNISIDNYGSELTGEIMISGHFEYGNLFELGEKIYSDVQKSDEDLIGGLIGGIIPLGIKNLNLETSYLQQSYELGGEFKDLRSSGQTKIYDIAISSKLKNTKNNSTQSSY